MPIAIGLKIKMLKKQTQFKETKNANQSDRQLVELTELSFSNGYWNGMTQPAYKALLTISNSKATSKLIKQFNEITNTIDENYEDQKELIISSDAVPDQSIRSLFLFILTILEKIGMPITGGASMVKLKKEKKTEDWIIGIPAIDQKITTPLTALRWACGLMNDLANGKNINKKFVLADLESFAERSAYDAPHGVNTLRFINAAQKLGIPWMHISANTYQFGWGKLSRWLDSSFTDQTSVIAATISVDKFACARVLRQHGFPVPTHQLVYSEEQAQEVAEKIGYPVVVKPADRDRGVGVRAGVFSSEVVRQAYREARKDSGNILVENFISGKDYRLQVHLDNLFWCALRRPALVIGTGSMKISDLIKATNAYRETERAKLDDDPMKEKGYYDIVIDSEAMEWLEVQNLTLDSIPEEGREVRLKGAANVSLGGTRQGIPLDRIHPDNKELVVGVISALRLDIAGIDLIVPDISESWKNTGGAICEVNARPQLSPHLHESLLQSMFPNKGLIPIVGINTPLSERGKAYILEKLSMKSSQCQIVDNEEDCRKALFSPALDIVIWIINPESFSSTNNIERIAQDSPIMSFNELMLTDDQKEYVTKCSKYYKWGRREASKVTFIPCNDDAVETESAFIEEFIKTVISHL